MDYLVNDEARPGDLWQVYELAEALAEAYQRLVAAGDAEGARDVLDELTELLDQALIDGDPAHPVWHILMSIAIECYGERVDLTGEPADRDELIRLLGWYLNCLKTPAGGIDQVPGMPASAVHRQLAWLRADRYRDPRQPERDAADLELAIAHGREALRLGPDADISAGEEAGVVAGQHAALGMGLAMRYGESLGGPGGPRWADGQEAITEFRLARTGLADPDDPEICWFLGKLIADRYLDEWPGVAGAPADRDEALSLLTAAAEAEEPDQDTLITLMELADRRLTDTSDRGDREVLIKWGELLLRLEPEPDEALRALAHCSVGLALRDRAEYAADPRADLAAAIAHLEAELELTPPDDPDRGSQLGLLVGAYWDHLGGDDSQHAAMDRMTELAIEAWSLTPPATEDRALTGLYLATGLYERFRRPGEAYDLARALFAMEVLAEIEPQFDDTDLRRMTVVLMMTFKMGYAQVIGSAEAMGEAEPWILRAIDEIPADDPQWAFGASNLSMGMVLLASAGLSAEMTEKAVAVLSAMMLRPGVDPVSAARIEGMLGLVLVQRTSLHSSADDLDQGIAHLRAFWEAAQDDSERGMVAANLGSALMVRYTNRGDRQDLDAARWYLEAVTELGRQRPSVRDESADFDVIVDAMAGMLHTLAGHADGDPKMMDAGIAELRSAIAVLPSDSPLESRLHSDLGLALLMRTTLDPTGAEQDIDEVLDLAQAGRALPKGSLMRPLAIVRLAGVLMLKGITTSDPAPFSTAIGLMTDLLEELGPDYLERIRYTAALGTMCRSRYGLTGDQADIKAAIGWLEQSRAELVRVPGHTARAPALMELARCYRLGGDLAAARGTGLAALGERGQHVLLQTGTVRGLGYAGLAASESTEVADWCLADGEPNAAVAALELGRSLVLHAATVVTGVAELLAEAGQTELAARWRDSAAASPLDDGGQPWDLTNPETESGIFPGLADASARIPDDLRVRVLRALAGTGTSRLTDSPSCADIAAAVAGTGADALVYLLEPVGQGPGYAIIVPAEPGRHGGIDMLELPLLARSMSGSLDGYISAYADYVRLTAGAEQRWRQALEQLCDWAWLTAMRTLLERVGGWGLGRAPRLVLVPVGRLSVVPWQAARSGTGLDRGRFACSDAVISYAASGRLLIEVSRRPALDLQAAPVIVADPAHSLPFAALEAEAIAAGCYPASRYLGQVASGRKRLADGRGTSAELLAELPAAARPGASVLHLGCHVRLVGSAPSASYLELAGGEHLTIETILRQAGGRAPQAPGGLVTLAACVSDYGVAAYDEALSLATAFLAGGAVTVASARWFIDDDVTTLLMFMFHYFMTARDQSPRDALRLAQLWMLDPDRSAPAQMPSELAKDVPGLGSVGIAEWAAFTHQGR